MPIRQPASCPPPTPRCTHPGPPGLIDYPLSVSAPAFPLFFNLPSPPPGHQTAGGPSFPPFYGLPSPPLSLPVDPFPAPAPAPAPSQVRIVRRVIDSDEYDAAVRRSPAACPLFALGDERRRATRRGCRVGGVRGKRLRERAGRAV